MNLNPNPSQEDRTFEDRWQAWQQEGRVQERQRIARRLKIVKGATSMVLLAALVAWSRVGDYESILRFLVTGGAVWATWHAFADREYGWAAIFTLLAVVYNPIFPMFSFTGAFALGVVIISAVIFASSLIPMRSRVRSEPLPRAV